METEKFELMLDEAQANAALEKGMLYADTFVNKNYLINLDRYPFHFSQSWNFVWLFGYRF